MVDSQLQKDNTRKDPKCRLCKDAPDHIVAECKMQAGHTHTERHNQVVEIVFRNSCDKYGLEAPEAWL